MERLVKILLLRRAGVDGLSRGIFFVLKMAQVAIHEAKKVLRRELKKRVAAMTDEVKLKESTSIVNKVSADSIEGGMHVRSLNACRTPGRILIP